MVKKLTFLAIREETNQTLMSKKSPSPPHGDFDDRLRAARVREDLRRQEKRTGFAGANAGIGFGFRISIELVAAVAIGAIIGYGLDSLLGTLPLLMVVFLLLGSVAGVLNAYRAVKGYDSSVGFGAAQRRAGDGKEQDDTFDK